MVYRADFCDYQLWFSVELSAPKPEKWRKQTGKQLDALCG